MRSLRTQYCNNVRLRFESVQLNVSHFQQAPEEVEDELTHPKHQDCILDTLK